MSDPRRRVATGSAIDDLRALGDASLRDVPAVEHSVAAARALRERTIRRRRIFGGLAILAAAGLLIAPVPYRRAGGSLYAFARDIVIHVRGQGRTSDQVRSELRRRLEDEGLTDTKVSVTDADGQRQIQIERPGSNHGAPASIGVGLDGAMKSVAATMAHVEVKKIATERDGVILHADVMWQGHSVPIDVPHSETMSEADLAREIASRLRSAGLEGSVSVERGTLQIAINPSPSR